MKENYILQYLSTAPVVAFISLSLIAGFIIEINRYFPDALIFAF
uniref:Photosystem I reaction center subunit IX n=1 Tax=Halimeda micronesica TaxID=170426 RepID=A0A386AXJ1_9CHLO|nr:photosystem I reaction center subunit IX [Halimeda micronesica]